MDYVLVGIAALLASGLTFFSGFGLGTLLLPVFALFFPVDVAVALTAIVHLLNNLFKLVLVGKSINVKIALLFGLPAILFAFLGAKLLTSLSGLSALYNYTLGASEKTITPINLCIGALLVLFSLFDLLPGLKRLGFPKKYLPLGGALSGFFGGLSGHQGALRSAFLIRANLSKEAFIATGVVIACFIDFSRISIYWGDLFSIKENLNLPLLTTATTMAFLGAFLGNKYLKKITLSTLQNIVGFMLIIFGVLLALGIL